MSIHTPTPWRFGSSGIVMSESYTQPFAVANSDGTTVIAGFFCDVIGGHETATENAAFTVRAVNNHEGLISALQEQASFLNKLALEFPGYQHQELRNTLAGMEHSALSAIAKATATRATRRTP